MFISSKSVILEVDLKSPLISVFLWVRLSWSLFAEPIIIFSAFIFADQEVAILKAKPLRVHETSARAPVYGPPTFRTTSRDTTRSNAETAWDRLWGLPEVFFSLLHFLVWRIGTQLADLLCWEAIKKVCKFDPHCETKDQFMIHPAVCVCVSVVALARECDFLEVLVTGQSFVVHTQVCRTFTATKRVGRPAYIPDCSFTRWKLSPVPVLEFPQRDPCKTSDFISRNFESRVLIAVEVQSCRGWRENIAVPNTAAGNN